MAEEKDVTGIDDTTERYMAEVDRIIKGKGFRKDLNLRSSAFGDLQNRYEKEDAVVIVTRDRGQWIVEREGSGAKAGRILPVGMMLDDRMFEILKAEINEIMEG